MIGTEPGQKPYLFVYAGVNGQREVLSDMFLFDFTSSLWIPVGQAGFIPTNGQGLSGRHSFSMEYVPAENQMVVFGGQSHQGQYCKPIIQVFQLPRWLTSQEPEDYKIIDADTFACARDTRSLECTPECGCLPGEAGAGCRRVLASIAGQRAKLLEHSHVQRQRLKLRGLQGLMRSLRGMKRSLGRVSTDLLIEDSLCKSSN